jgi:hypothetical protein
MAAVQTRLAGLVPGDDAGPAAVSAAGPIVGILPQGAGITTVFTILSAIVCRLESHSGNR